MEKPQQAKARELYQQSRGRMLLKDIAAQLSIAESTVRSWKKRYNWDGDSATLQTSATQRRRNATTNRRAAEELAANSALNEREKDFTAACLHTVNMVDAALATGRYGTRHSARQAVYEMRQNPAVEKELERIKAIKRSMLIASADDVVELHLRIAFADMSAFAEWGQEEVYVMGPFGPIEVKDEESGKKIRLKKVVNTVRFREHDQVDGAVVQEVKVGRNGASIKLADRQKSLDFLERYFLLNPMDKHKTEYDLKRLELEKRKNEKEETSALAEMIVQAYAIRQGGGEPSD